MSLQTLFSNPSAVARFEAVARQHGYTVFKKRGGLYCLSALNDFAEGYVAGHEEARAQLEPFKIDGEPTAEQRAAFVVDAKRFQIEAA